MKNALVAITASVLLVPTAAKNLVTETKAGVKEFKEDVAHEMVVRKALAQKVPR